MGRWERRKSWGVGLAAPWTVNNPCLEQLRWEQNQFIPFSWGWAVTPSAVCYGLPHRNATPWLVGVVYSECAHTFALVCPEVEVWVGPLVMEIPEVFPCSVSPGVAEPIPVCPSLLPLIIWGHFGQFSVYPVRDFGSFDQKLCHFLDMLVPWCSANRFNYTWLTSGQLLEAELSLYCLWHIPQ